MRLYNFRDLGGLTTKCKRAVKPGLVFRTGNVAHWGQEEADAVVNEKGVRLYIDLRNSEEVVKFGRPEALLKAKIEWCSIAIDTSDKEFERQRLPKAADWLGLYQRLFDKNLKSFSQFAKLVAETNTPLMYGCLFGKDRTGIASSLLLNLLDVHDDLIAKDYAKTTDSIQPLADMFRDMLHNHGATDEELFEHYSRSHEHVMLSFLEYLRTHPEEHLLARELKSLEDNLRAPLKARLLK